MYREVNWETWRKLIHGISKCHATYVKQQATDRRPLHKYAYMEHLYDLTHIMIMLSLFSTMAPTLQRRTSTDMTIKCSNIKIHVYAFKILY